MADYIYAGTKAKTLETYLLTDTQVELLLGSRSLGELFRNLQDTFLAPYTTEYDRDQFSRMLEHVIEDTKRELVDMAPQPALLDVLWIRYDFYNLRALMKGDIAGLSDEDITPLCFTIGLYSPAQLVAAYRHDRLAMLDERLNSAYKEAQQYKNIGDIDLVMNLHYLTTIRDMAATYANEFVTQYVTRVIDLFNLISSLRISAFEQTPVRDTFIDGGTFHRRELESTDSTLEQFPRLGGPDLWKEALDEYRSSGSFSLIEKAREDYFAGWLKERSYEIFSPAALFAYFTAVKNNVQTVRAIHVGKDVGLEEHDIRHTLRKTYR